MAKITDNKSFQLLDNKKIIVNQPDPFFTANFQWSAFGSWISTSFSLSSNLEENCRPTLVNKQKVEVQQRTRQCIETGVGCNYEAWTSWESYSGTDSITPFSSGCNDFGVRREIQECGVTGCSWNNWASIGIATASGIYNANTTASCPNTQTILKTASRVCNSSCSFGAWGSYFDDPNCAASSPSCSASAVRVQCARDNTRCSWSFSGWQNVASCSTTTATCSHEATYISACRTVNTCNCLGWTQWGNAANNTCTTTSNSCGSTTGCRCDCASWGNWSADSSCNNTFIGTINNSPNACQTKECRCNCGSWINQGVDPNCLGEFTNGCVTTFCVTGDCLFTCGSWTPVATCNATQVPPCAPGNTYTSCQSQCNFLAWTTWSVYTSGTQSAASPTCATNAVRREVETRTSSCNMTSCTWGAYTWPSIISWQSWSNNISYTTVWGNCPNQQTRVRSGTSVCTSTGLFSQDWAEPTFSSWQLPTVSGSVTVSTGANNNIECTFSNRNAVRVVIQRQVRTGTAFFSWGAWSAWSSVSSCTPNSSATCDTTSALKRECRTRTSSAVGQIRQICLAGQEVTKFTRNCTLEGRTRTCNVQTQTQSCPGDPNQSQRVLATGSSPLQKRESFASVSFSWTSWTIGTTWVSSVTIAAGNITSCGSASSGSTQNGVYREQRTGTQSFGFGNESFEVLSEPQSCTPQQDSCSSITHVNNGNSKVTCSTRERTGVGTFSYSWGAWTSWTDVNSCIENIFTICNSSNVGFRTECRRRTATCQRIE